MSIGDSGGEENLGKAQAYCPRGKVNKMMEASSFDVREGTPPGATETSRLTSRSCGSRRRHSPQPLQSTRAEIH
jgi:hypothetical protein